MLIGYRRVLAQDSALNPQLQALVELGCEKISTDTLPHINAVQPNLVEVVAQAEPGDVLVIWQLDQIGKPLGQLLEWLLQLCDRGIHLYSLQDQIDTRNYDLQQWRHLLQAFVRTEQTLSPPTAQKSRPSKRKRKQGPGNSLSLEEIEIGRRLAAIPGITVDQICKLLNISQATYYRHIPPQS